MEQLLYSSVETLPHARASVAFTEPKPVFKEDGEITPTILSDTHAYMPWGATNLMPFDIIDLIESDETLATCQMFNAEVCYGSGLVYDIANAAEAVKGEVEDFLLDNDLASYFLGVCQDFKHFAFAVSVIILNTEGTKIVRLIRKEACYCRFAPADTHGKIPRVYFANWRKFATLDDCEIIEMLDAAAPFCDLRERLANGDRCRKFAIVSRVPTPDSTYYPIPYYAALFRGKWFNIKQLIGLAKEAKLRNSAPLKYHIEVSQKYWDSIFKSEGITDRARQQARIVEEKRRILDFLTGAENSGKVWFSTFYVNPNGDFAFSSAVEHITVQCSAAYVDISLYSVNMNLETLVFTETYYPYNCFVTLHDFASIIESNMSLGEQPLQQYKIVARGADNTSDTKTFSILYCDRHVRDLQPSAIVDSMFLTTRRVIAATRDIPLPIFYIRPPLEYLDQELIVYHIICRDRSTGALRVVFSPDSYTGYGKGYELGLKTIEHDRMRSLCAKYYNSVRLRHYRPHFRDWTPRCHNLLHRPPARPAPVVQEYVQLPRTRRAYRRHHG